MDICTATNHTYLKSAINLVESYRKNSYNKNVFLYYFNVDKDLIYSISKKYLYINFIEIPNISDYIYNPKIFLYKTYAIFDCMKRSDGFIYSDATNVINKNIDIDDFLIDDSLFLPYNHEKLLNKYWTTNKCFEIMECTDAKIMPQYWAGFQVYKRTFENELFVEQMFKYMLDPNVAFPDESNKLPDGNESSCLEHRQDQSVFSNLIHKHFRHQRFDLFKQQIFGDWQTFKRFDNNYKHNLNECFLSSRESKFGSYRFLKNDGLV